MRFKQICNHPSQWLGDAAWKAEDSGKFARLRELAEVIAAKQEKVLVFTQFRETTEPLAAFLGTIFGREGLVLHGGTPVAKRRALVQRFQEDELTPFFVLSLKAGGAGLNLTAASHVIHFDRWWNPAVENQATDRAFRIGQQKNVLVHKFVCRGTIEDRIDQPDRIEAAVGEGRAGRRRGTPAHRDERPRVARSGAARHSHRAGKLNGRGSGRMKPRGRRSCRRMKLELAVLWSLQARKRWWRANSASRLKPLPHEVSGLDLGSIGKVNGLLGLEALRVGRGAPREGGESCRQGEEGRRIARPDRPLSRCRRQDLLGQGLVRQPGALQRLRQSPAAWPDLCAQRLGDRPQDQRRQRAGAGRGVESLSGRGVRRVGSRQGVAGHPRRLRELDRFAGRAAAGQACRRP